VNIQATGSNVIMLGDGNYVNAKAGSTLTTKSAGSRIRACTSSSSVLDP
jgi:hypothetical protein